MNMADAKRLAMNARTESLRVAMTEAAKAQQEASSVTFAMASESGRGWDPDAHLMPIAEAILDAYRRGIEVAAARADSWYVGQDSESRSPGDSIRTLLALAKP